MTLLFELIQGLQQTQWELAESIRQIKEFNKKEENNERNHDERESNRNGTPFVTMSDVADLFKQKRERTPKEPKMFARKPFYLPHGAYKGEEEPIISSYGVYYSCCQ
jgi:NCAIR mutase (PurE)-related protein